MRFAGFDLHRFCGSLLSSGDFSLTSVFKAYSVAVRRVVVAVAMLGVSVYTVKSPVRAASMDTSMPVQHAAPPAENSVKDSFILRLRHMHTNESLNVVYKVGSEYSADGMEKLNHFLRDHRTQDDASYDPREFDLLHKLMAKLGRPNGEIDIVCGYRTAQSNAFLRTRAAVTGVAEHSQHILSKAIDIRVPGVSTLALRNAALSLGMGGVGYYPKSQFVHVDVGPVREWSFGGGKIRLAKNHVRHGRRHARSV
jgi:uncharacterized protein YcbK (DUF882 family)